MTIQSWWIVITLPTSRFGNGWFDSIIRTWQNRTRDEFTVRARLNGNSTKWCFRNKNLFVETKQNGKLKMVNFGNFVDKMVIFVDELNIQKSF